MENPIPKDPNVLLFCSEKNNCPCPFDKLGAIAKKVGSTMDTNVLTEG